MRGVLGLVACSLLLTAAAAQGAGLPPFLGAGGSLTPHPKGCAAGTVWYSAEAWWRRELAPVPDAARDFGHLHNEACWPHLLTLSAATPFVLTSLAHQNPGREMRLGVQAIDGVRAPGAVGDGCPAIADDEHGIGLACKQLRSADNRTAWRCLETGGAVAQASVDPATTPATCKWVDTLNVSPATLATSGLHRMRMRVVMDQPSDVVSAAMPKRLRHMRALFSGPLVIANNGGAPLAGRVQNPDENNIKGVGWGTGTNYSATQLWGPPKLPLGGLWRPWARMERGSVNSVPLARHQVLIDANFHADQFGTVLRNDSGAWSGQLSIDTATLTPGWHKLTLQAKAKDPGTGATNTGSLAVWFEAAGPTPAKCGQVPIQTHATADSTLLATKVTVTRKSGSTPTTTTQAKPKTGPALNLAAPASRTTVGLNGASRQVATASYARLSFGLGWLAPSTSLADASLWVHVAKGSPGSGTATLAALDGDSLDADGLPSPANRLGQVALTAASTGTWVQLPLDADKVAAKLATAGKALNLALTLDAGAPGGFVLAASASKGAPLLLLTPAC